MPTISTLGMSKTAGKPQSASAVESAGPKNAENSITVTRKQPEIIDDTDEAQGSAPSQKDTTTRPKRALAINPTITKINKEWNGEEEESAVFAKSNSTLHTSIQ